ncbi:hypothetical protein GCM10027190_06870 [Spirosoma areae]
MILQVIDELDFTGGLTDSVDANGFNLLSGSPGESIKTFSLTPAGSDVYRKCGLPYKHPTPQGSNQAN